MKKLVLALLTLVAMLFTCVPAALAYSAVDHGTALAVLELGGDTLAPLLTDRPNGDGKAILSKGPSHERIRTVQTKTPPTKTKSIISKGSTMAPVSGVTCSMFGIRS